MVIAAPAPPKTSTYAWHRRSASGSRSTSRAMPLVRAARIVARWRDPGPVSSSLIARRPRRLGRRGGPPRATHVHCASRRWRPPRSCRADPSTVRPAPAGGAVNPARLGSRSMARRRLTLSNTPVGVVDLAVVTPVGTRRSDPLPLLVAHDGPEYSRRAHLLSVLRAATADRRVPATRVVLLEPGPRNERYAANPLWAEALVEHVLPRVRTAYATDGKPALMGASLGALASLQAEWLHPGTFGALFLQSGSFFRKRLDDEEDFEFWDRVTAFVPTVRRARRRRTDARIVMTCGTDEGNLANNRQLAQVLAARGHDVALNEVPGRHDWRSWEAAFDPYLLDLLRRQMAPILQGSQSTTRHRR